MLLTSVLVSLLAWLTCSTPIFIVDERLNIYIYVDGADIQVNAENLFTVMNTVIINVFIPSRLQ